MHYPPVIIEPAPASYRVLWPVGNLGWRKCSERMYRDVLARPEAFVGVKVMRIDGRERR